jgi:hypothetical protein
VGWYSTGPRIKEADIDINQMMADYVDNPVLVITEVEVSCGSRRCSCSRGQQTECATSSSEWPAHQRTGSVGA